MNATHTTLQQWTFPNSGGLELFGNTHLPADAEHARGVVILCHGFKGYKDYGFLPRLAQHAAACGLIAHRFNFRHSGVTHEHATFARPDLFERDTWVKQIADIARVLHAHDAGELPVPAEAHTLPVVLFGHSRGGIAAMLAAAAHSDAQAYQALRDDPDAMPLPRSPAGVISAAAPASANNLEPEQQDMLRRVGRLPSPSNRTGQELYIGREWLETIDRLGEQLDPVRAAAHITSPLCIIHGTADATAPPEAAQRLHDAAPHATLHWVEGASHTFDAPNPLPDDAPLGESTQQLLEHTCQFACRCADAHKH